MTDRKSLAQRLEDFRPSKGLWFWSCAGCVIATIIVGFTVGGWVTGGTAQEMTKNAAGEARAQLVANVCVEKFVSSNQFADHLASLKKADSWDRDSLIEDGGWVTLAGMDEPTSDAADLCADRLVAMEAPAKSTSAEMSTTTADSTAIESASG